MSKREAVDHLHGLFSHMSRHWLVRHFVELMSMDPENFWRLAYKDETGETAVANVMGMAA